MKILPNRLSRAARFDFASTALVLSLTVLGPMPRATAATDPTTAVGTLAAVARGVKPSFGIEMPDVKVDLLDKQNAIVTTAVTQIDGSFRLKAPAPGLYSVCWNIQGRTGCKREVLLRDGPNALRRLEAQLEGPVVFGRVLTGDQRPCWVNDPFFKLNVSTRVQLLDDRGKPAANPVRANVHGDYLFVSGAANDLTVHAACEKAEVTGNVQPSVAATNLTLPNHAPRIVELAANDGSKSGVRVASGTSVNLVARVRDRDGDAVEYLWRHNDGQPIAAGNISTLTRTTLGVPGLQSSYLVARDGRGGYAFKRFDLEVGPPQIQLSGIAIDETTRAPVANATVDFGGLSSATDARGWFSITGPKNADDRYVLNIRHPNFAVMSRVYDRSSTGNTYELIAAQVTQLPAHASIDMLDTASSGPCGTVRGQDTRRANRSSQLQTVEYFDPDRTDARPLGTDLIKRLTLSEGCRHVGAQIRVAAGSLVRVDRKRLDGGIRMAMATLNPTRRALPGDYQAIDSNGKRTELLSYGAVYAEFRDRSGALLKLRAGATAEVRVPVPGVLRATAAPSIDFWSYDEKSGKWALEGKANLVATAAGAVYVGKTKHFSTLNMDVAGNDPAKATCVRFETGPSLSAWTNLKLRATVSYNGNAVQTKETFLDGQQYNAIYRIPFGSAFPPNTLRVELFGTFNGQSVVLVDNIINTDARPKMTGIDLWPPYPYTECGDPVTLNADPIALPAYATNDATGRPYFLTGPGGDFLPDDAESKATAYYAAIDPSNTKATLGAWWAANGFSATDGGGGTRAAYLNFNDLGFGRDMNCLANGTGKLACYVTNYGAANQNPANADAAEARDASKRGASVAMEFDPAAGKEAVQFYVYGNTGPTSDRLKFADLDGFGPKPVPQLCLVCHGANPGLSASGKVEHARFREFDLPSLKYSSNRSWDYGATTLSAAELASFGALNQLVQGATPTAAPIHKLVGSWYPSGFSLPPAAPTATTTPPGWAGNVAGYNEVYGKTCRTCHIARDGGADPPGFYTFNNKDQFDGTSYAVCGAGRVMPNAIVTYKNYWADPARVLAFEALMSPAIPSDTCKNN